MAIVGAFAWPYIAGSIPLKLVLGLWIFGFSCVALAKFRMGLESRDPYDLKLLKKVDDLELWQGGEDHSLVATSDEAYCINCGAVFDSHIPVCPRCKKTQGGGPLYS